MIEVIDRIPTHPGRVKMTPVEGQENTYDMVRADEPIEAGTPINKALFDSYANKINAVIENVDNTLFNLSQRVPIGDLAVGSLVGIYENGVLVPYIKIRESYRSDDFGTTYEYPLVVRLNAIAETQMYASAANTKYFDGPVDSWLENEFFNTLGPATRDTIPSVSVRAATGSSSEGLMRRVFVLSLREYSFHLDSFATLGVSIDYFQSADKRVSYYQGTPCVHYTRSCSKDNTKMAVINPDGNYAIVDKTTVACVRPAFTLLPTFEVTAMVPSTANVTATAEVIE